MQNLLFTGQVRHRRFAPKLHQFAYKTFMFCFDLANIHNTFKNINQVSIEKFNWFAFRRENYLSPSNVPLDDAARNLVFKSYKIYPTGKIYLLTQLSCFGYCFNPISIYFVFDELQTNLEFLILEVTNTPWGERHHYVLQSTPSSKLDVYKYQFQKQLHVSPFMVMDYVYKFNLKLNADKIIIHMENHRTTQNLATNENATTKDFDATLTLKAQNNLSPRKVFFHYPFITYKITAAIYWQALKLWLKGVPFHSHPRSTTGSSNADK